MKADVIIQARNGSSRLPHKVFLQILNKPIIEYIIERIKIAKNIRNIIIATTTKNEDNKIVDLAKRLNIKSYRGKEEDVLDRFYQASKIFNLKHIVRITADCPLIDPDIIDTAIMRYFDSGADYCSNTLEISFPDGEDVEVFRFASLRHAWKEADLLSEREHVTPFMTKHPEIFKLESYKSKKDLSDKRWTLDEKKDYEFIKSVIEELYPKKPDFRINDILSLLKKKPYLEEMNKNIERNEGYQKSLRDNRRVKIK